MFPNLLNRDCSVAHTLVRLGVLDNDSCFPWERAAELQSDTKYPYVVHAEANAITKIASSTQSSDGATLYISLSPCKNCSKLIHQAKIKRVVYEEQYKDTSGLEFLQKAGVEVCQIKI